MGSELFFTVVVPTYNRGHLIKRTLESLLAQTWPFFEIIVVDDGSTDDTAAVVNDLGSTQVSYYRIKNSERAAARNYGALHAKGNYINFFDSDDLALPNHLSEAAKMVSQYGEPAWFHLGFALVTPEGRVLKQVNTYQGNTLQAYIPKGNPLSCNGVFLRSDIIQKFAFNEDRALSASEDYELWYRLAARYPLFYTNTITSWIVDHEHRSVRKMDMRKLIDRLHLLLFYLKQDDVVQEVFKKDIYITKAGIYAYLALHLSEHNFSKKTSFKYLLVGLSISTNTIMQRTFYATLRNLILRW